MFATSLMQHKYLKYCFNSRLCWLEMDKQETLASFNLILIDFESEIMTVGSGHGRETRSVRTVLPVPPCTHPEVLAQKIGTANPPRTNVRIHNVTLQSLANLLLRTRRLRALTRTVSLMPFLRSSAAQNPAAILEICASPISGSVCHWSPQQLLLISLWAR